MWFSHFCLAGIFNHKKSGTKYYLIAYNGLLGKIGIEICDNPSSLIDKLYEFSMKVNCENVSYDVQFLSCSHKLSNSERQRIVRKHKSSGEKRTISEKYRSYYRNMGPAEKKNV